MRGLNKIGALLALSLPLGSCVGLSTGILASPAGINHYSFRACLLDDGFFTPTALVGVARQDFILRHRQDKDLARPRNTYLEMNDLGFIGLTARRFFEGLLPHQQYGGAVDHGDILNSVGDRPFGENIAAGGYPPPGFSPDDPPGIGSDRTLFEGRMNRYLDCYIAPVGPEDADNPPGLLKPNEGDYDLEGRLLRAHVLLAMLAQYGTELVTSHASAKQPAFAAMLLKDITNAEMELRLASPVMDAEELAKAGLITATHVTKTAADGTRTTTTMALSYPSDNFNDAPPVLRWDGQVSRILLVFQVAQDDESIDANQSLDRLTNIIAAFSKPTLGAFKGLLTDSLKGLGEMQKVSLYGDAMLRDSRETLAHHRLGVRRMMGKEVVHGAASFDRLEFGSPDQIAAAQRRWTLWDGEIRGACTVLAAIAKDNSTNCVPSPAALRAEFEKRATAAQGAGD